MRIKTKYVEFEFKHEDAVFKLREVDMTEVYILSQLVSQADKKIILDAKKLVEETLMRGLIGWTGLQDEAGADVAYSAENILVLPYTIKSLIVDAIIKQSTLTEEKKSS